MLLAFVCVVFFLDLISLFNFFALIKTAPNLIYIFSAEVNMHKSVCLISFPALEIQFPPHNVNSSVSLSHLEFCETEIQ